MIELIGRINKCGVISPRFDVSLGGIEQWTNNLLPSRQFGYIVLTTSLGIMDHEEVRFKSLPGLAGGACVPLCLLPPPPPLFPTRCPGLMPEFMQPNCPCMGVIHTAHIILFFTCPPDQQTKQTPHQQTPLPPGACRPMGKQKSAVCKANAFGLYLPRYRPNAQCLLKHTVPRVMLYCRV